MSSTTSVASSKDPGFAIALEEAKIGAAEGGIPIGACLVSASGEILGRGRNRRVQLGSATRHAEIDALESAGRLPASAYRGSTMYTTLSPCDMCSGACVLFGVQRVVIGENDNYSGTGVDTLRRHGVEVVVLGDEICRSLMSTFMREKPDDWNEDIGV